MNCRIVYSIGTLHATFTLYFLGRWYTKYHPIYFCYENLHIASFDQMFNQNIRNGNWIISNRIWYIQRKSKRYREGFKRDSYAFFVRKRFITKRVRGYLLFQVLPSLTHTAFNRVCLHRYLPKSQGNRECTMYIRNSSTYLNFIRWYRGK